MSDKQHDDKNDFREQIKKLWLPISGFIGAVTLVVNFYQLWLGNRTIVIYVTAGLGLLILIVVLGWVGYKNKTTEVQSVLQLGKSPDTKRIIIEPAYPKERRVARIALVFIVVGVVIGVSILAQRKKGQLLEQQAQATLQVQLTLTANSIVQTQTAQNALATQQSIRTEQAQSTQFAQITQLAQQAQSTQVAQATQQTLQIREDKLIVLIAKFDGPEENFGLRNEILEKLHEDFAGDTNVQIETTNEVITPDSESDSSRARKLGQSVQADVVIWGWYRSTENPRVTIHIENLSPTQIFVPNEDTILKPVVTLEQLSSFEFQIQTGQEVSAFVSFLAGYIKYNAQDYESALSYFDRAINETQNTVGLFDYKPNIYFYRGVAKYSMKDCKSAILDYMQVVNIDRSVSAAYFGSSICYSELGDYASAIRDIDKAIGLAPEYEPYHYERGRANYLAGNIKESIDGYDKALSLMPNENSFLGKGLDLIILKDYKSAIESYTEAINLNPKSYVGFNGRGVAHAALDEYQDAVDDFSKAIEIDDQPAITFVNLAGAYLSLKDYSHAIDNATIAIGKDSRNLAAHQIRSYAYYDSGDYNRAIMDCNVIIGIDKNNASAYLYRGKSYLKLGDNVSAKADFKKYEDLTGKKPNLED